MNGRLERQCDVRRLSIDGDAVVPLWWWIEPGSVSRPAGNEFAGAGTSARHRQHVVATIGSKHTDVESVRQTRHIQDEFGWNILLFCHLKMSDLLFVIYWTNMDIHYSTTSLKSLSSCYYYYYPDYFVYDMYQINEWIIIFILLAFINHLC